MAVVHSALRGVPGYTASLRRHRHHNERFSFKCTGGISPSSEQVGLLIDWATWEVLSVKGGKKLGN